VHIPVNLYLSTETQSISTGLIWKGKIVRQFLCSHSQRTRKPTAAGMLFISGQYIPGAAKMPKRCWI